MWVARAKWDSFATLIQAARELGAKGFVVVHRYHFYDEHFEAVREAVSAAAGQ